MILIEKTCTYGWEAAIRGMRNPMNSWGKSDTNFMAVNNAGTPKLGKADLKLMKTLSAAGNDHGKFLRMITVTTDITAPLYWWKEFDTYKVGTVANSCSTMHKIWDKEFTLDDFSHEHLTNNALNVLQDTINALNDARYIFHNFDSLNVKGRLEPDLDSQKEVWWQMIQLLPSSYNQKRTVQFNYAVLKNIFHARQNHKLDEWRDFCFWMKYLPYSELIIGD